MVRRAVYTIVLWIHVVTPRVSREPECPRFHYEEQLLEKMVRMEFNMEQLQGRMDSLSQAAGQAKGTNDQLKADVISRPERLSVVGSVYTRWGSTSCPSGASYIYDGYGGGAHYTHSGGGVNYLCLPKDPIWDGRNPTAVNGGLVYGGEYETGSANILNILAEREVPCAVCQARGPTLMIPARNVCYDGWKLEYYGYLMTSHYEHANSKEYVCVDVDATMLEGSDPDSQDGALFYFVRTRCGALKCPPYNSQNQIVLCSVCSQTP